MHYTYDPKADALYIYLREDAPVSDTVEIDAKRNVDLDAQGKAVGIEVLSPRRSFPIEDLIARFELSSFRAFLESVASTPFKPVAPEKRDMLDLQGVGWEGDLRAMRPPASY